MGSLALQESTTNNISEPSRPQNLPRVEGSWKLGNEEQGTLCTQQQRLSLEPPHFSLQEELLLCEQEAELWMRLTRQAEPNVRPSLHMWAITRGRHVGGGNKKVSIHSSLWKGLLRSPSLVICKIKKKKTTLKWNFI